MSLKLIEDKVRVAARLRRRSVKVTLTLIKSRYERLSPTVELWRYSVYQHCIKERLRAFNILSRPLLSLSGNVFKEHLNWLDVQYDFKVFLVYHLLMLNIVSVSNYFRSSVYQGVLKVTKANESITWIKDVFSLCSNMYLKIKEVRTFLCLGSTLWCFWQYVLVVLIHSFIRKNLMKYV